MKQDNSSETYKRTLLNFYNAVKVDRKLFALSFLVPIGNIAIGVGVPLYASKSFASVISQSPDLRSNIALLAVFSAAGVIMNRIGFQSLVTLHAAALNRLNTDLFRRILQRGTHYHSNQIGGKLVSDALDYMGAFGMLHMLLFTNGATLMLTLTAGLMVLFSQSYILGLFIAVVIAVTGYATYIDAASRSRLRTKRHEKQRKMIAHFSDSIVNALTIKTFASEHIEAQQNVKLANSLQSLRTHDWAKAGRNGNTRVMFLLSGIVFLLVIINYLVKKGDPSTLGAGIFAFTYTYSMLMRLFQFNEISQQLEDSFLKSRIMTEMLLEDVETKDAPGAKDIKVDRAKIDLINVQFHYEEGDSVMHVFKDLNLLIKPGEKIGLVGPSGGGKTTLTKLLLRFDDIQSGSIEIDGQNIAKITQESLRLNIGYVPQEPLLFHRTIEENIAYGKHGASQQEVIEVAKQAEAHDFISKLPLGYDTVVGERGVKLSGGQRQRVAIARTILKDAPIVILDEATSALDSESEKAVQHSLNKLMKNKTSLVIAHRLSTIQQMDRILVLDDGAVVEEGTHQTLKDIKGGLYAKLWAHQSGGFLED